MHTATTTTTTTRDLILDLLVGAADAHGSYEAAELGGVYDEGWPDWYATHMTEALEAQGYRLARIEPARREQH